MNYSRYYLSRNEYYNMSGFYYTSEYWYNGCCYYLPQAKHTFPNATFNNQYHSHKINKQPKVDNRKEDLPSSRQKDPSAIFNAQKQSPCLKNKIDLRTTKTTVVTRDDQQSSDVTSTKLPQKKLQEVAHRAKSAILPSFQKVRHSSKLEAEPSKGTEIFDKSTGTATSSDGKLRAGNASNVQLTCLLTLHQSGHEEEASLTHTSLTADVKAVSGHHRIDSEDEPQQTCTLTPPQSGNVEDVSSSLILPTTHATAVIPGDGLFPEQIVVSENQLTQEDLSRLMSLGTLPKNPTFTEKGREFYNSKVAITGLYKYFAPFLPELCCNGIYIVEKRDTFYNVSFEGKIFTAIFFKSDPTHTLSGVMKKMSQSFWHSCASYLTTKKENTVKEEEDLKSQNENIEEILKSQSENPIMIKVRNLVANKVKSWGFDPKFEVGFVKNFSPDSEYQIYVLLFNKEKIL